MQTSLTEGVHLALPPHIFSVQVKLHQGPVGASSEQNKRNLTLTLTLNLLLPSIAFYNKICFPAQVI